MKKEYKAISGAITRKAKHASLLPITFLILSLFVTSSTSTQKFQALQLADPIVHILDSICMVHLTEEKYPGLAISVIREGGMLWSKGYGYANKELNADVLRMEIEKN